MKPGDYLTRKSIYVHNGDKIVLNSFERTGYKFYNIIEVKSKYEDHYSESYLSESYKIIYSLSTNGLAKYRKVMGI